jgi:hypothetical protein
VAVELSASVFQLLAAGWFHKGISSANIALLPATTATAEVQSPIEGGSGSGGGSSSSSSSRSSSPSLTPSTSFLLLGFQASRPDASGQVSRDPAQAGMLDSYRHPLAVSTEWGTSRYRDAGGYRPEFDVYSLGAVLAELGLWRPLREVRANADKKRQQHKPAAKPPLGPGPWAAYLRAKVADDMPGMMGGRFAEAVGWCLATQDRDALKHPPAAGVTAALLAEFEDRVLRHLMTCRI